MSLVDSQKLVKFGPNTLVLISTDLSKPQFLKTSEITEFRQVSNLKQLEFPGLSKIPSILWDLLNLFKPVQNQSEPITKQTKSVLKPIDS